MKKTVIYLLACLMLATGCAAKQTSSVTSEQVISSSTDNTEVYQRFSDAVNGIKDSSSYTYVVNSSYEMGFSDDTQSIYDMDGVLQVQDAETKPVASLRQNISSNGASYATKGNYYGGKLYNTFNELVSYYEKMSLEDLQKTLLVPLKPGVYKEAEIDQIKQETLKNNIRYTYSLESEAAKDIFSNRYDSYGLNEFDNYQITTSLITDTFDTDGNFIEEKADFEAVVTYSGETIKVHYSSDVKCIDQGTTEVVIDADTKKEQKEYVSFENIDTSKIETGDAADDSAEDSAVKTFKKRLIGRLGYQINDDGIYEVSYNNHEVYRIDFENSTFTYSSYSISYTYRWKGEIGAMGKCTYHFTKEQASSDCTDETVEMIRKVKTYLEMELYYCGLSLDDLVEDTK